MTVETKKLPNNGYLQGEAERLQVAKRRQRGSLWRSVFIAATMVGIIALLALLYNIINSSFGYVAVQNTIDPSSVVMAVEEERILATSNLTASENDETLAEDIAANPYAIGFFGYAYFQNREDLRVLSVDGVEPTAATVESGEYTMARPLYLYTTAKILQQKAPVAEFVNFYLTHVNAEISNVGYFPASQEAIDASLALWQEVITNAEEGESIEEIVAVGSSTVFPLTQQMAERFQSQGFTGSIQNESIGTSAGLAQFCDKKSVVDIANASRAIKRAELDLCKKAKRTPLELRVGTDALAIVVSQENDFLTDVSRADLVNIFMNAEKWSDVNPEWPSQPIERFIPGTDSGTLDFFVEEVTNYQLADMPKTTLVTILEANVSKGLMRRFENDKPFAERTQADVLDLVNERVIEPEIIQSWSLSDSIFKREEIEATVAGIPNGTLSFRSWISMDFLTSPQSSKPDQAGIRTAIVGSLWVIFITLLFSLPLGVGAAIYLEEYGTDNWLNRVIETNINNLAGVPSIIYGMLGLAIFVRVLEALTSGTLFGTVEDPTTANGRTVVSAGLTLGLLILPIIIINAREAIRAVPASLRQASYGLGATKWQTVWNHVLPAALPGVLTGNILAMSRAIGETAPLVVIGASTFIVVDPNGPFAKFTTLPIQIYQWTARPQDEFRNIAAAAIVVLLILLLTLNASAILLRNRFSSERV